MVGQRGEVEADGIDGHGLIWIWIFDPGQCLDRGSLS
jgi:hypothetical protein